jgi:hypothetical protein
VLGRPVIRVERRGDVQSDYLRRRSSLNQRNPKMKALSSAKTNVTFQEIAYRLSNPKWLASQAWRTAQEAVISRIIPSRFNELFHKVKPITMVSYYRLRSLYLGVHHVVRQNIPGDIVECGVALGGSSALLGLALKELAAERGLWMFDTYAGMPEPSTEDPDHFVAKNYAGMYGSSPEEIRCSLAELGVTENVHIVPGFFQDTLAGAPLQSIALLHVDGDWYESVKCTLDTLYDKVSPGGIIQFDDYGHWAGARKAVDAFLSQRVIRANLEKIDFAGRKMVKPAL